MNNPWTKLEAQTLHPDDRWYVDKHDRSAKPDVKVQRSLSPLPFVGDPLNARVILLGKNPSFEDIDELDAETYPELDLENRNSLVSESEFPFFYLNPKFSETNAFKWWWNKVLGQLLVDCDKRDVPATVALKRIACIQWHAYRSKKPFNFPETIPTQLYNFALVENAIDKNRLFVIQYGDANARQWRGAIKRLPADAIRLKSSLSPHLSPKNMQEADYQRVLDTICKPDE